MMSAVGSSLFEEWRLVFVQQESRFRFWAVALGCGAAVACIAQLFRYEQRLISLRLGFGLLGLRLALILVLFLTLLEPVWTWSRNIENRGRAVVSLDVSASMRLTDLHAERQEKLRWARAAGLFGPDADGRIARWIRDLDNGREPQWVADREAADPETRQRMAQARKDNFEETLRAVEQTSRAELARRALLTETGNGSVLDALGDQANVEIVAFGKDFSAVSPERLKGLRSLDELNVDRNFSNLSQAAEGALSGGAEGGRLTGLIIISDGRDTAAEQQDRLVTRLKGLGIPVHTVMVGSEFRPRDLSIAHVEYPTSMFKSDKAEIKAMVRTAGFENQTVTVKLETVGDPGRSPQLQTVTPTGPVTEVALSLDPLDLGRHKFQLSVLPDPRETRDDNNLREFSINVVDDRAQVLIVDGEGRWEFRYLDNALKRDEQVSVSEVLFEQPYLGILRKPFFPQRLDEGVTPASGSTPFSAYDVVILGDVSPRHMTLDHWRMLNRYVSEEGGTLICTAGKRFFPLAFRGTLVDALLPVENLRVVQLNNASQLGPPATRGFRLAITSEGAEQAMFQLADDRAASSKIWSELPGHPWGIVGDVKGGATVWAAAMQPGQQAGLEHERKNAVVAQHFVGNGQVVWIGVDSTWRWRHRVGDLYHHRFWGQLVRWAVSFKAASGSGGVKFGMRESVIREGQPASLQVRFDQRFLQQYPQVRPIAVVEKTDGGDPLTQRVPLVGRGENPLMYEGQAVGLPPGEYRITLDLQGAEPLAQIPELSLIVNEEQTPELMDVTANRSLLEQIARETGGTFLQLDEIRKLPELFSDSTESRLVREEIPLWSHWLTLVIFCGIAMTEWVLRKLNGLP